MTLGDLVKKYREDNNISMDAFSKKSNLSKGYISMLENNINPRNNKPIAPTLPTIKKIAHGMNMELDTLLKSLSSEQKISLELKEKEDIIRDNEHSSILVYYNQLNEEGKKEAAKRVEELTYLPKYTISSVKETEPAVEEAEAAYIKSRLTSVRKTDLSALSMKEGTEKASSL